jgi:hypothetical protein
MSKKQSEKVRNALKTLEVSRQFSQAKMTYGLGRVDQYTEDNELPRRKRTGYQN